MLDIEESILSTDAVEPGKLASARARRSRHAHA